MRLPHPCRLRSRPAGSGAFAASALVLLACVACDSGAPDDSGMNEFLAGIPMLDLTEETSVGSESGEIGPIMSRIGGVVLGPDLAIYVADPSSRTVTRFDPDLSSYHSFGGEGEGPGEAASLTHLSVSGDSLLVVSDGLLWRVSLFTLDGEFLDAIPDWTSDLIRRGIMTYSPSPPAILLPDGSGLTVPLSGYRADRPLPIERTLESIVVRHHPERKPDQILSSVEYMVRRTPDFMRGGVRLTIHEPFGKTVFHTLMKDGSGVVAGYPISPDAHEERGMEVRRLSIDGTVEFTRTFPAEWTALHDWMIQDRLGEMAERLRAPAERNLVAPPTVSEIERHVRRAGLMPPHPNPVLGVVGTESGSVWVALENGQPDTAPWIRLDRSGDTTGQIVLPRTERIVSERDHRLLTVRRDPMGVETLVVYRSDPRSSAQPE